MMDDAISAIKKRIEECKATGNMFTMPKVDGCAVEEREGQMSGSTLAHSEFVVRLLDGRFIQVDYQVKDKSHSFQVVPDRSYITVECSDHGNDFSDSWEEK